MAILVSGGAGYIGSHTCVELLAAGYDIVVADNYYNSCPEAVRRVKEISGKDFRFEEIDLTDAEKAVFQPQLENIVKYVEKIASVDVTDVPPTMHGREIVNAFREDVVRPSLDREAALANAPARTGDEFMLPKIVEGAES